MQCRAGAFGCWVRPVMAEEEGGGGGGGANKDRIQFLRTFVVFLCKKTDKLLASC